MSITLNAAPANGGTSPYTYQWYASQTSGFTPGPGNILAGKTGLTLVHSPGTPPGSVWYYRVIATDANQNTAVYAEVSGTQALTDVTTFDKIRDNRFSTLTAPHQIGETFLRVAKVEPFQDMVPTVVTMYLGLGGGLTEQVFAKFRVSAIDAPGKKLIIGPPLEGYTDRAMPTGTRVWARLSGASWDQVTEAINALQSGGVQGPQGSQGGVGATGTQGSVGGQGPQGRQGFQGSTGVGTQGVAGAQGNQGFQGVAGIGTQGNQGSQGFQGTQGFQGNVGVGTQGAAGGAGPQGANGSQGAAGPQGATGIGTQGSQGSAGGQGPQGSVGVGSQGFQGNQGNQGAASTVPGPQGGQGYQGNQGSQGAGSTLAIGSPISGSASKSVLWVDSANKLAQSSTFVFDSATNRLGIGNATPGSLLDMQLAAPLGTTVGSTQNCLNLRTTAGNNLQFQIYANRHQAGSDFTGTEWVIRTVVDSSPFNLIRIGQLGFNSYTAFDSPTKFNATSSHKDLGGGGYGNASIDFNNGSGVTESFISSGQNRYGMGEISGQLSIGTQNSDMMLYTFGITGGLLGNNTTGVRFHSYRDYLTAYIHPSGINLYTHSTTTKGLASASISHGFVNSSGIGDNTHATRLGTMAFFVYDYNNISREALRFTNDGTKAKIGFFGVPPVARQPTPTTLDEMKAGLQAYGLFL